MIFISHPTGNSNVRGVVRGLIEQGIFGGFATTIAVTADAKWLSLVPGKIKTELLRRSYADVAAKDLFTFPFREFCRLGANRFHIFEPLVRHETGRASIDSVYRTFDSHVAKILPQLARNRGLQGVYAYEDGALETFRVARSLGLRCFYDQPIGHWKAARDLLSTEALLQPDWAVTLSGNRDSPAKLARKDAELALADDVLVASSFTHQTLIEAGVPRGKLHTVSYGAPAPTITQPTSLREATGPLRILFVGSLGQRKGLSYLLKAVELMGTDKVELTLVGKRVDENCKPLNAAIARYRYISSLPHEGVLAEMRRNDVFVFPSLFEGFGLVLLEAMSQGLPVITTTNTGAPDFVTDGHDGFIVPIRSADSIAQRLELLFQDRTRLQQMSECARQTAQQHTWSRYGTQTADILKQAFPRLRIY